MSRLTYWLAALLWAAVIFTLSTQSSLPKVGPDFPLKDKIAHLAVYALLGWLIGRALLRGHRLSLPKAAGLAIILVSLYGVSDEWHQSFIADRTVSAGDWLADTLGGALGQLALCYESRASSKKNR